MGKEGYTIPVCNIEKCVYRVFLFYIRDSRYLWTQTERMCEWEKRKLFSFVDVKEMRLFIPQLFAETSQKFG